MRAALLTLALLGALGLSQAKAAVNLSLRDRTLLAELGDQPVHVALRYAAGAGANVAKVLNAGHYDFGFIDSILTRVPAQKALSLAEHEQVTDLEIIDDSIAAIVGDLLTQLFRIELYRNLGLYDVSVLNISIGPPKHVLNRNRAAERTVRRAYERIIRTSGIPIVTSAGNDGPTPGFVNPWAFAAGVIAVGAANADGSKLWPRSSRGGPGQSIAGRPFFIGWGENHIGAFPLGATKTPEMLETEKSVNLAGIVGADNVNLYKVDSGTSFAAATVSRIVCHAHQMTELLRGYSSMMESIDYRMKPYVRGYIDTGIDRNHPIFANRLVDSRRHYDGLRINIDRSRKQKFFEFVTGKAINIPLRYSPEFVVKFLRSIARAVPGTSAEEAGHGFVAEEAARRFLSEARYSTVIDLFADPQEPRRDEWMRAARDIGDPLLFAVGEVSAIGEYCENNDLVLALPLRQ